MLLNEISDETNFPRKDANLRNVYESSWFVGIINNILLTCFLKTSVECILTLSLRSFSSYKIYNNFLWRTSKYCQLTNFYCLLIVRLRYISLDTGKRTQGRKFWIRKFKANIRKTHFYTIEHISLTFSG